MTDKTETQATDARVNAEKAESGSLRRLRIARTFELILLFVIVPVVYHFFFRQISLFAILVAAAIGAVLILRFDDNFHWNVLGVNTYKVWQILILRFGIFAAMLTLYVYYFEPDRFLRLFLERPHLLALIFFFYPLFSALPQEFIFRTFFYHRYRKLFPNTHVLMLVNATLFAIAHLIFQNWIAIVATFVLSLAVSSTYLRSRSLLACTVEHALYGNLIYLIGVGEFFYKIG